MNRLIKALALSIATLFALTAVASATPSSGWKVRISSPANTTSKTFNVEYTTLSITSSDKITVELFENNVSKGSQTTTKPYGDSGVFSVTVPSTGSYDYYIKANNTGDGTPKTTSVVNVAVTEQPQPTVNTVNVGSTDSNSLSTANTDASGDGSSTAANGGAGSSTGGTAGDDSGVNAAESGQVGDDAASTANGDVLGQATQDNEGPLSTKVWWILAALAGLALAAYSAYTFWWQPRHQDKS